MIAAFPEKRDNWQLVWKFSSILEVPAERRPNQGLWNDQIEHHEIVIEGLLKSCRYAEANKQYAQLLKEVAWEYGLNSPKFRCVADCFCTSLEAEGFAEEAARIRAK